MNLSTEIERRILERLRELEAGGSRRILQPPNGIDLSSNDYLGLSAHPRLKEAMAEAVLREGCGATASRLLRGERQCFNAIEKRFADFKKTESALYFGTGYAANLSVLTTFAERTDLVFSDELNHASIVDGIRLSRARRVKFPHRDVGRLAHLLRKAPAGPQKFLVTESLFSMDGDLAPLTEYAQLCRETDTAFIVDEAHAVGIYGDRGSGLIEKTGVGDAVFLSVNTAGKALGVAGAFVTGPAYAIDYLVQRARPFIFSTAPPPSVAAALDASLSLIQDEPQRRRLLLHNAAALRGMLGESGDSPIVPIILGENERACSVAEELRKAGFDIRAIRPPTVPPGTARLRISVNVNVDEETLQRFVNTLEACCAVYS